MFKKFFAALLAFSFCSTLFAQQDALYSQHVYNKLPLNPAYAGSRDVISALAMYRRQWVSFPGAPTTATVNVHSALANRDLALGFNLIHDELGITENTEINGSFAYRIPTKNGRLSFGLQATMGNFRMGLTDAVSAVEDDPSLSQNVNKYMFNAGAGVYYYTDNFYFGLSVPRLIKNSHRGHEVGKDPFASLTRHYYAMTGYVFEVNRNLTVRPSALVRYVKNAPVQADLGIAFLLQEKIWVGGQYRTAKAMDLYVEYQANDKLRFGYSFGQQLGLVGANAYGSHEILIGIDIPTAGSRKGKKGSIRCFF